MAELEEYFDEAAGTYSDGESDTTVAGRLDMSPASVISIRETYFGVLKELGFVLFDLSDVQRGVLSTPLDEGEIQLNRSLLVEHFQESAIHESMDEVLEVLRVIPARQSG